MINSHQCTLLIHMHAHSSLSCGAITWILLLDQHFPVLRVFKITLRYTRVSLSPVLEITVNKSAITKKLTFIPC
ncbi:hypothetical protein Bca4012_076042 [Brassica carinata]